MSSNQRKAEKRAEWAAEQERREIAERAEAKRKAELNMYMRIEEANASSDVKEILHMLAVKLGLEE